LDDVAIFIDIAFFDARCDGFLHDPERSPPTGSDKLFLNHSDLWLAAPCTLRLRGGFSLSALSFSLTLLGRCDLPNGIVPLDVEIGKAALLALSR
jgi:hypothetical protein